MLDLANTIGISAVSAEILNVEDVTALCVQRYDREVNRDGVLVRIHQEDLCQSLGVPPNRKYQQEGGPSALDLMKSIREWSSVPVLDVNQTLDLLIFNVVIGNADAHGKNVSWLYHQGSRRIAPAYDLVATTLWPELSTRLAMRIGQAKFVKEVTLDHVLDFGEKAGLNRAQLKARLGNLSERILRSFVPCLEKHSGLLLEHAEQLQRDVPLRIQKMLP